MNVTFDGNILAAGSVIKVAEPDIRDILKKYFTQNSFSTFNKQDGVLKLMFNTYEFSRVQYASTEFDFKFKLDDKSITIFSKDKHEEITKSSGPPNKEVKEVKEKSEMTESIKTKIEEPKEPEKSEAPKAPVKEKKSKVKIEEVESTNLPEFTISAKEVITDLKPGKYNIKFNDITFAILSQGSSRDYIKEEGVIEITDNFKKITGVNTTKRGKK
jgi:hypothetical protein